MTTMKVAPNYLSDSWALDLMVILHFIGGLIMRY